MFQADSDKFLCLDGKLHRQLLQNFAAEAVDDEGHRLLLPNAARKAIEELVIGDLRCGRLVLDLRRGIAALDVGHGVGAAFLADEKGIALRVVAGARRAGMHAHEPAIGVLRTASTDTLGDDPRARVAAQMMHLRARVRLLEMVGDGDGIELADGIVAAQDATWIFPGDR